MPESRSNGDVRIGVYVCYCGGNISDVVDCEQVAAALRGLTGVTRRRKTASIKAFFGFLTAHDLLTRNPARGLIPPEREQHEPRFLTTQEYRALLRSPG